MINLGDSGKQQGKRKTPKGPKGPDIRATPSTRMHCRQQ